jgi:hypothetical protein
MSSITFVSITAWTVVQSSCTSVGNASPCHRTPPLRPTSAGYGAKDVKSDAQRENRNSAQAIDQGGLAGQMEKIQRGAPESQRRYLPAAIVLDLPKERGEHCPTKLQEDTTRGDKSPKAKDKSRKQDPADKNQKALAANVKMSLSPVFPGKKAK